MARTDGRDNRPTSGKLLVRVGRSVPFAPAAGISAAALGSGNGPALLLDLEHKLTHRAALTTAFLNVHCVLSLPIGTAPPSWWQWLRSIVPQ